jgi:hypothetical protein
MRIINPEDPIESSEFDGHVDRDRGANWAFLNTILVAFAFAIAGIAILVMVLVGDVHGRDVDGRYAQEDPKMKAWFDQLASGKGLCCSFADGVAIKGVDWDTQCKTEGGFGGKGETRTCRYRVRLHGEWIMVPEDAMVTEPNKFGPAVVWPYMDTDGATQVRCFLPGAGT